MGDVLSELAGNNLGKKHAVERRRREDECAAKEDEVAAAERDLNRLSAQAQIASRLLGEKRDERETLEKALLALTLTVTLSLTLTLTLTVTLTLTP